MQKCQNLKFQILFRKHFYMVLFKCGAPICAIAGVDYCGNSI